MVQPKYSPEEALQRVKLMMRYDSSKTLNENKSIIFEQSVNCKNKISPDDLTETLETLSNTIKLMDVSFVRMFYADDRAKEVFDIITRLNTRNVYDETVPECRNALVVAKEDFKKANQGMFFFGGDELDTALANMTKGGYYSNKPQVLKYLKRALEIVNDASETSPVPPVPVPPVPVPPVPVPPVPVPPVPVPPVPVPVKTSQYRQCSETLPIAMYCKNTTISKVQGCLGFTGRDLDGKFGPTTSGALVAKGVDGKSITQASIDKVCGGGSTSSNNPYSDYTTIETEGGNQDVNTIKTTNTQDQVEG
jgi:hypothetical protein